jgi:hypothetical protein
MAGKLACISSRKSNVFPSMISVCVISANCSIKSWRSEVLANKFRYSSCSSKLISIKYSNRYAKFLTAVDFPTCRAPLMSKGFLDGEACQSSNAWSIFLSIYMAYCIPPTNHVLDKWSGSTEQGLNGAAGFPIRSFWYLRFG